MSAENTIMWAVRAPSRTMLGSSQRSLEPVAGGACCPLPKKLQPHPALGLWPRFSALSQQSSFPPMRFCKGLDKNTVNAHFRSQRIHQNTPFCIKIYKKIPGGRDTQTGP